MESDRCNGWTSRREFRNNLPCANRPQPGKAYCKLHDPERIEIRDAARLKRWLEKRDERLKQYIEQEARRGR